MRRGVERDGVKVCDMPNLVHPLRPCVLTGHDVPAQVDGDGVWAVHPALLAKGVDGSPSLDRGVEFVDALPEAEGIRILNQHLEDRPRQTAQLRGLEPPRPDGGRCVIDILTRSIMKKLLSPVARPRLISKRSPNVISLFCAALFACG